MTQGCIIRKLLASLASIELHGLHQTINVTFQHHAVIHDGGDFIDNLRRSKTGIHHQGESKKQRFPVLHTFSIMINRKADYIFPVLLRLPARAAAD